MATLLTAFSSAFAGSAGWAAAAALAWGLLSVALSPCHLSGIPLVVAYMSGEGEPPGPRRALGLSSAFAAGTLGSVAAVGAVTLAAGRIAGDVGRAGILVLGAVLVLLGLQVLGVVPLPSWGLPATFRRRGAGGALLLGLLFGAALGPCSFAFMAPLLAVALAAGRAEAARGALLVAAFALGHAAALVLAGVSAQGVQRWLAWRAGARAAGVLRAAAGTGVVLGGLWFVYTAP